jgi:hypothetical protein
VGANLANRAREATAAMKSRNSSFDPWARNWTNCRSRWAGR